LGRPMPAPKPSSRASDAEIILQSLFASFYNL
jgi:hypothetical protein